MEGAQQQGKVIRERRRKSTRKPKRSWSAYLRSRDFARLLFAGMVLLAVVYFARYVWDTRMAGISYSGLGVGSYERDVRYILGRPTSIAEGGKLYRYEDGAKTVTVRLSDQGGVASVKCSADLQDASKCDPFLDLRLGAPEDVILLQLGAPSRSTYAGDDKIMHYDGLGVSFWMRKFRLYAIELHDRPTFMSALPRALWRMVP